MASATLSKTPSSAGNRKKFNFSFWLKGNDFVSDYMFFSASGSSESSILFDASSRLEYYEYNGSSKTTQVTTNRVFRDPSAWLHINISIDTTQSTASNRVKFYVNGVQETSLANSTYGSQNFDSLFNNTTAQYIGSNGSGGYFDGSMTHVHFNDGYAYDASTFGETDSTSGIWKPKTAPSVTYGTNGFFLKFENSAAMGTDSSGNSNTFTVSGTLTQNVDTPSNNFATMNPLDNHFAGGTFSNGNNTVQTRNTGYSYNTSTIGMSSGKWYWEMKYASIDVGSGNQLMPGIAKSLARGTEDHMGYRNTSYAYTSNGSIFNNNAGPSYGDTYAPNDIIGFALDLDNNKFYVSKNGTWQNSGVPTSGSTGTGATSITAPDADSSTDLGFYFVAVGDGNNGFQATVQYNFGGGYFGTTAVASAGTAPSEGGIFEYDCPSGYQALCTKGINSF